MRSSLLLRCRLTAERGLALYCSAVVQTRDRLLRAAEDVDLNLFLLMAEADLHMLSAVSLKSPLAM